MLRSGELIKLPADRWHRGTLKRKIQDALFARNARRGSEHFRDIGELSIALPGLKRPTLSDLQAKHNWIKSIERDTSTEEPVTLALATVLAPDEDSISGKEYEKRIVLKHNSLLGSQHREWLLAHQDEFPVFKALLGKVYIDFPGLVVVRRDGHRSIPFCFQNVDCWSGHWHWSDEGFRLLARIAFAK